VSYLDADAKVRVGVVGCGAVTERYHLPALLACSAVNLVAMVDTSIERAQLLAARVGAPLVLSEYASLPGKIDLAIVAVPNALHEKVAVSLLQAGVHVLVEKPMARTSIECDRMLVAAAHSRAVLAIGHDFRHFPVARFTKEFFAADLLGTIQRVNVQQSTGIRWPYASGAALLPEAGGGVLIDFGVHLLDLLLWWLGDLRPVACRHNAAGGVETECELELVLLSGAPVHFELSRTRRLRNTIIIEGEHGTLEVGVFDPTVLNLSLSGQSATLSGALQDPEFQQSPLRTVFGRQLADTVAAVQGRNEPLVGGGEGRRVVKLVEDCYALHQPLRFTWDYPEAYISIGRTGP
jgi:predicted dehydrogenase